MVPLQEPGDRQRCSCQRGLRTWKSPEQLAPSSHIQPELSPVLRVWPWKPSRGAGVTQGGTVSLPS